MAFLFSKKNLVLCFFFVAFASQNLLAQDFVRLTAGGKNRQAQTIKKNIEEPASALVGLELYANNLWRDVFFYQQELESVKEAAQKYLDDFEGRKLRKNNKSSLKKYGAIKVRLEWSSDKNSLDRFSIEEAKLGYYFYNGAPYFSIFLPSAKNQNSEQKSPALQTANELLLLFTKSQILDLISKLEK